MNEKRATIFLFFILGAVFVYAAVQYNSDDSSFAQNTGAALRQTPAPNLQPSNAYALGQSGRTYGPGTNQTNKTGIPPVIGLYTKRVFVTSNHFSANFGGLSYNGAKTQCAAAALNGSLGGQWIPWLSYVNSTHNTTFHARDQIIDARYVRLDGIVVADNKADLLSGDIDAKINVNEFGQTQVVNPNVWTGTNDRGLATGQDCNVWTSATGTTYRATQGSLNSYLNQSWTDYGRDYCYTVKHIYCFEK